MFSKRFQNWNKKNNNIEEIHEIPIKNRLICDKQYNHAFYKTRDSMLCSEYLLHICRQIMHQTPNVLATPRLYVFSPFVGSVTCH